MASHAIIRPTDLSDVPIVSLFREHALSKKLAIWLAACATAGSEPPIAICPPVVEYGPEFQAQAADELAPLPEHSALAEMLADYAVILEQAWACSQRS